MYCAILAYTESNSQYIMDRAVTHVKPRDMYRYPRFVYRLLLMCIAPNPLEPSEIDRDGTKDLDREGNLTINYRVS
jgi:hypothetical protein